MNWEHNNTKLQKHIEELVDFFGHPSLSKLEGQIFTRRLWLRFVSPFLFKLLKFAYFRMIVIALLTLFSRKPLFCLANHGMIALPLSYADIRRFQQINMFFKEEDGFEIQWQARRLNILEKLMILKKPNRIAQIEKTFRFCNMSQLAVLQQLIFLSYANSFCYFLSNKELKLLCTANDHSPIARAFLYAAQVLDHPTLYTQHAEVTSAFPVLDTDYALLFNRQTIETYQRIATNRVQKSITKTAILPAYTNVFSPKVIIDNKKLKIGLFLSYFFNESALQEKVSKLALHPNVSSIFIFPHPRNQKSLMSFRKHPTIEIVPRLGSSPMISKLDLALVSNSSVTIELLHAGIRVLYFPEGDEGPYDYYGFVSNKIVRIFNQKYLSAPQLLENYFNEEWRTAFVNYDPTIEQSLDELKSAAKDVLGDLF